MSLIWGKVLRQITQILHPFNLASTHSSGSQGVSGINYVRHFFRQPWTVLQAMSGSAVSYKKLTQLYINFECFQISSICNFTIQFKHNKEYQTSSLKGLSLYTGILEPRFEWLMSEEDSSWLLNEMVFRSQKACLRVLGERLK